MTNAVKFVKGAVNMIEGLAIPFGGPIDGRDLDGEYFSKNTDLCLDWFDGTRPLLYHHGLDGAIQAAVVGRVKSYDIKDDGMWVRAQLDKNSRYREVVGQLIDADGLGFSSGTMSHLVDVDAKTGEIKRWPWVEESLTPTPANPLAMQVYAVKTTDLVDHLSEIDAQVPEPLAAALKALDEWADRRTGSELEPYAAHGQRVLADVKAFVVRSSERQEARAKADRTLSAEDRARLVELQSLWYSISADVDAILRVTDPMASSRAEEAQQLLADFVRIEASLNGVPGLTT